MSKIVRLQAENFKRLHAIEITPNGNVVEIKGRNEQGKTSILDAIAAVFGGADASPRKPIRDGEDKSIIIAETEDLIVKRTYTEAGSQLVLQTRDGSKVPQPQAFLDRMVGKLAFDPMAFMRLDARKQAETLRQLTGLDFTDLDKKRKAAFDRRSDINRDLKNETARLSGIARDPTAPAEEVSVQQVAEEYKVIVAGNEQNRQSRDTLSRLTDDVVAKEAVIKGIEGRIRALQEELRDAVDELRFTENKRDSQADAVAKLADVDPADALQRMKDVESLNARARKAADRRKLEDRVKLLEKQSGDESDLITSIDAEKSGMLSSAKFPVEGLSFDENGVNVNNVPFEQTSGAQKIRISMAMALAINPTLRVVLIRDGNMLDPDSMAIVHEMAAERDAQIWIELVAPNTATGIVIEDGSIVHQNSSEGIRE